MKHKTKVALYLFIIFVFWLAFVISSHAEAPTYDVSVPVELQESPVKSFAYRQVSYVYGEGQWDSFNSIIQRESGWDCNAKNPTSTAYGLGQLLNSTRQWLGLEKTSDCYIQVDQTIAYISKVYGTPNEAWREWQKKQWY